jgi:hypothetical protein
LGKLEVQIAAYASRDSLQPFLNLLLSEPVFLAQSPQCENTQNNPGQQNKNQENPYKSMAWLDEEALPCCATHWMPLFAIW